MNRPIDVHMILELPLSLGQMILFMAVIFAGAALLIMAWQGMELLKIQAIDRRILSGPRSCEVEDWPGKHVDLEETQNNIGYGDHWKS
jgi:hypothetical protein